LIAEVQQSVRPGDVLLLKGSRGMAMEELIRHLES
jgi:UDP-N-acetylmuramyl pentapeptide synthase